MYQTYVDDCRDAGNVVAYAKEVKLQIGLANVKLEVERKVQPYSQKPGYQMHQSMLGASFSLARRGL